MAENESLVPLRKLYGAVMNLNVRVATLADMPALLALEQQCFALDRLNQRNFHWMLARANACLMVAESDQRLLGYALLLFHRGTSMARLYSLAVAPDSRGLGLGQRLLSEAEAVAVAHACAYLRLEVRLDNPAAIALYEALGYRRFAEVPDYYEDHSGALRYEKCIAGQDAGMTGVAPYYAQTTEFTCGAACLLMAMAALQPQRPMAQGEEIQIWREATTVYMTAGHGGCSPQGLALAALRRGFGARLQLSRPGSLFLDGVRSSNKKAVMQLVEDGFTQALAERGVEQTYGAPLDIQATLAAGLKPVVLISSYRLTRLKAPHWVMVTGCDQTFVYLHDPDVDHSRHRRPIDCQHVPVTHREFQRMSAFGRQRARAAVLLYALAS